MSQFAQNKKAASLIFWFGKWITRNETFANVPESREELFLLEL